jgi:hypothetical protein
MSGEQIAAGASGMLGSAMLEVAAGMAFLFILVSVTCTAVREGIESMLKTRAAYLEHGIRELLHDRDGKGLAKEFFNHPLIFSLYSGDYTPTASSRSVLARGNGLPSYIPARNFASALFDIATRVRVSGSVGRSVHATQPTPRALRAALLRLENEPVRQVLLAAFDGAGGNVATMRVQLEAWFDSAMDRVSGWYKRSTQWITLVVALLIAVGLNVDSIRIAQFLYLNETARSEVVRVADDLAATSDAAVADVDALRRRLTSLSIPVGWDAPFPPATVGQHVARVVGWLLTALAAMLGAPFWFDVLNRVMVIRATVKPHEKSPEESSEDRQRPERPRSVPTPTPVDAALPSSPAGIPLSMDLPPLSGRPDNDVDGCDALAQGDTPDERLPAASGGVHD